MASPWAFSSEIMNHKSENILIPVSGVASIRLTLGDGGSMAVSHYFAYPVPDCPLKFAGIA